MILTTTAGPNTFAFASFTRRSLRRAWLHARDFSGALARRASGASVQLAGGQQVKPYRCVILCIEMKSPRA